MTYTTTYPEQRSQSGGVFVFIVLIVIAIIVAITVYLRSHATDTHGEDAVQARNCIQNNGVWKVYQQPKSRDGNIFHWLCMDPQTGTVFDMIVEKLNEMTYQEKTAFKPKGGKWESIRKWLEMGENRGGSWVNPPQGPFNLIPPP